MMEETCVSWWIGLLFEVNGVGRSGEAWLVVGLRAEGLPRSKMSGAADIIVAVQNKGRLRRGCTEELVQKISRVKTRLLDFRGLELCLYYLAKQRL
jgi:hypothetical protein